MASVSSCVICLSLFCLYIHKKAALQTLAKRTLFSERFFLSTSSMHLEVLKLYISTGKFRFLALAGTLLHETAPNKVRELSRVSWS